MDITWPDVVFTAQDVVDTVPEKVSRVTIHSKLNKAVDMGDLTVVGAAKTKNGRPRIEYMKTCEAERPSIDTVSTQVVERTCGHTGGDE